MKVYSDEGVKKSFLVTVLLALTFVFTSPLLPAQDVSVMTYNIRFDDKGDTPNSWVNRKADVLDLIEKYNPQIVGVQEALTNQLEDMDKHLQQHRYFGVDRENDGSGEYCAIFYNSTMLELKHHATFWLHPDNETGLAWDAACPRIATYGVFADRATGAEFLLVNTHFDHVGQIARMNSVDLILDSIETINAGDWPVILMGDFNMTRDHSPMLKLVNLFEDATYVKQVDHVGTYNGFNHDVEPKRKIDYILTGGDCRVESAEVVDDKYNGRFPSDHLPVLAEINLNAFQRSDRNARKKINTNWLFTRDSFDPTQTNSNEIDWQNVTLPHSWNTEDVVDEEPGYYRGKCWYRKSLNLEGRATNDHYYLHFEGANQVLDLYVNGQFVGSHTGGYTSFSFDISPYLQSGDRQEILIGLDNAHNPDIIPLEADFNFYGGIYRDVYLEKTRYIHYDRSYGNSNGIYLYPYVNNGVGYLGGQYDVQNHRGRDNYVNIEQILYDPDDKEVARITTYTNCSPGLTRHAIQNMEVKNPILWEPGSPNLYTAVTNLYDVEGNLVDHQVQDIGFRTMIFNKEDGFVINGRKLKLIGTNRHQDHGGLGNALSNEQHIDDLLHLRKLGINFLRISHYPQDPVILSLADQLGFVTTEEIPFVNEFTNSDAFMTNTMTMLREMIRRDFNHTSLFAWASSNELSLRLGGIIDRWPKDSSAVHLEAMAAFLDVLHAQMKELDPTRYSYIVHCCGKERNSRLGLHNADIIGYNKYFGWYEGEFADLDGFIAEFDALESNKPFILSEYGAGADPRVHSLTPKRFDFSIEYQTAFHKSHLQSILKNDRIHAANVWNYADFMAEHRRDAVPHVNNKGLVDLHRRPKDAWYYYRAALADEPYVAIPSKMWTRRGGITEDGITASQPISIFTNLESVELYLNDASLGCRTTVDFEAEWDVPFKDGENNLVARACNENKGPEDQLSIDFEVLPSHFSEGMPDTLRINVGSHCYFIADNEMWYPDQAYKVGTYGYLGGQIYLRDNRELVGTARDILGTTKDPVYQTVQCNMNGYQVDVPKGTYRVVIHIADVVRNGQKQEINDQKSTEPLDGQAIFINGSEVGSSKSGNPMDDYRAYAFSSRVVVGTEESLNITFDETVFNYLNGLEVIRID